MDRRSVATGTTPIGASEEAVRSFLPLPGWRVIEARGDDARAWLHDLVTTDVDSLQAGRSRRSLILTPTGRIRADVHVGALDGSFLLLQAPDQPAPVDGILAPYVLSSAVVLEDRTERSVVVAVLGGAAAEDGDDAHVLSPSVLAIGDDLVADRDRAAGVLDRLRARGLVETTPEVADAMRVRRGIPRMGADFGPDALPAEAGLERVIDFTKGCFLGQESVAKVRNLGHPPTVLVLVRSAAPLERGTPISARGVRVGEVTSVASGDGGWDGIARVRWDAAGGPLLAGDSSLTLRSAL